MVHKLVKMVRKLDQTRLRTAWKKERLVSKKEGPKDSSWTTHGLWFQKCPSNRAYLPGFGWLTGLSNLLVLSSTLTHLPPLPVEPEMNSCLRISHFCFCLNKASTHQLTLHFQLLTRRGWLREHSSLQYSYEAASGKFQALDNLVFHLCLSRCLDSPVEKLQSRWGTSIQLYRRQDFLVLHLCEEFSFHGYTRVQRWCKLQKILG